MITIDYIHKIIGECVDAIRPSSQITDVATNSDGNQVITVANTLNAYDVIKITDGVNTYSDIVVLSATETNFVIEPTFTYDDQLTYSYQSGEPYYMHEKQAKANELLTEKNDGSVSKWKKYPLFILLRPFAIKQRKDQRNIKASIDVVLVNLTEAAWNADDRFANNFEPIMDPMVDEFLNQIVKHPSIVIYAKDEIDLDEEHECLIDGNPLPDTLDGILIRLIDLPIKKPCEVLPTTN